MPALVLLALLCCTGCHGQLVAAMEERNVASCWWWRGPFGGYGVTATGGVPLERCLQVPCPCAMGR